MKFQSKNTLIDLRQWHKWFAWKPVRIDEEDKVFTWIWLEQVERKILIGRSEYFRNPDYYFRSIRSTNNRGTKLCYPSWIIPSLIVSGVLIIMILPYII